MLISTLIAIGATLAAIAAGIAVRRIIESLWRYRGPHIIMCPENGRSAAVRVDAVHAAMTALGRAPELRLSGCSRWPERAVCGQQCLGQIRAAPDECRVLEILAKWYEDKYCVSCGQPVGRAYWTACNPALLTAKGSQEWSEIPVAELPETLSAAQPLCFHCHVRLVV